MQFKIDNCCVSHKLIEQMVAQVNKLLAVDNGLNSYAEIICDFYDFNICQCENCVEEFLEHLRQKYSVQVMKKTSNINFLVNDFKEIAADATMFFEYKQFISEKFITAMIRVCAALRSKGISEIKFVANYENLCRVINLYDLAVKLNEFNVVLATSVPSKINEILVKNLNGVFNKNYYAGKVVVLFDYYSYCDDKTNSIRRFEYLYSALESKYEDLIIAFNNNHVNLLNPGSVLVLSDCDIYRKDLHKSILDLVKRSGKVFVAGKLFERDLFLNNVKFLKSELINFDINFDGNYQEVAAALTSMNIDFNVNLEDQLVEDNEVKKVDFNQKDNDEIDVPIKSRRKKKWLKRLMITTAATLILSLSGWAVFAYSTIPQIMYLRELFVGTAMTTATKKWMAEVLIPKAEIQRILKLANPDLHESTNGDNLVGTVDISGIVGTSKPYPGRPLKITELNTTDILKIQKIQSKTANSRGTLYIREAIVGAHATVKAKDRYKYEYPTAKRYLIEKGMDTFYVDVVTVKNAIFTGKMLIISDPSKVVVSSTKKLGSEGQSISQLIKNVDGIGGVNGGGYKDAGWMGNGGNPNGLVISDSKTVNKKSWRTVIGFNKKNKLIVGNYGYTAMKKLGLRDALEFTPALIINGKPQLSYGSNAATGIHPRTAIGQRKTGEVVLLTIDGRQEGSVGASLYDVQNVLLENGCINAGNLDGGHSSYMMFNNKIVNQPYQKRYDKKLANAFVITP